MHTITATSTSDRTSDASAIIPEPVSFDLYRDIHKAIRNELFAVTSAAGSIDPADTLGRRRHAERVHALVDLLVHHADHEDSNLDAVVDRLDPTLTVEIAAAHAELERRLVGLSRLAEAALETTDLVVDGRAASHALYLELASFTAAYLQHQDFEERVVMRTLDANLTFAELLSLHEQILASVAPDVMGRCLELMLPAINLVDRTEMLAGMRAGAPAEVFAATWALAGTVLSTREYLATAARLDIAVDPAQIA
jgi:hypothetical protein